jgi:hypothetical protein
MSLIIEVLKVLFASAIIFLLICFFVAGLIKCTSKIMEWME